MKNYGIFISLIAILSYTIVQLFEPKENSFQTNKVIEPLNKIEKKDKPGEMMAFEFERLKNPTTGEIPIHAKLKAYKQVKKAANQFTKTGIYNVKWTERGPNNVGGRTRALMFDPNDGTRKKVWAGSVGGGIWYNDDITNASSSWKSVNDFMGSLAVTCLAYDPVNTNIFYAGTGEGYFNADAQEGLGIWKTVDGGKTWNQLESTIPDKSFSNFQRNFTFIQDLVVAKNGDIFITTRSRFLSTGGLLKSSDGGTTWVNITPENSNSNQGVDIEIAANGDLYVTFGLTIDGNIFRSTNNGDNWTDITPQSFGVDNQRTEIAIAPSSSSSTSNTIIYALSANNDGDVEDMVVSSNGGTTWTDITIPDYVEQDCSLSDSKDFTRGQSWYNLIAAVKPDDPSTIIIGGIDLFKSNDGGMTWNRISDWADRACSNEEFVHADQHQLLFRPGSNTELIIGNDGGVFYSSDISEFFVSFESRIKDYNVTQFYAADIPHAINSSEILAGAQDNGTHYFDKPGINSTIEVTGGDGAFCFFDEDDNQNYVTSYIYNNMYFFLNGQYVSELRQNTGLFINPLDLDSRTNLVYSSDISNQYRVTDFSAQSEVFDIGLNDLRATAIKVSPFTDNTILIGTSKGEIFKIINANTSPIKIIIPVSNGPNSYINYVGFGANENEILVTITSYGAEHIWYTPDNGTTWIDKSDNLPNMPVYWALVNPENTNEVLIATEYGVWSTTTFTSTPDWVLTSDRLANVRCDMLQYNPFDKVAVVATHGRGVFTAKVFESCNDDSEWIATTSSGTWHKNLNWINGIPTSEDDINLSHFAVPQPYTIRIKENAEVGNLNILCKDITIELDPGVSLSYGKISGNGNFIINDGASIIPLPGSDGTCEGNFIVKRNKPENQPQDFYNAWASPIKQAHSDMLPNNQGLTSLRLGASSNPGHLITTSGPITNKRGYLAKNVSQARFEGLVNSGYTSQSIVNDAKFGGGHFNFLGNPYPSAISAQSFIQDNQDKLLNGGIYLWNQEYSYDSINSPSNFTAINYTGSSQFGMNLNVQDVSIPSVQGFGINAAYNTRVEFNNQQRNDTNSEFKNSNTLENQENIWIGLNVGNRQKSILVAFGENATHEVDFYFDAPAYTTQSDVHFASLINNQPMLINSLPSEDYEIIVPLEINTHVVGDLSFQVLGTDNFSDKREVYIKDKKFGTLSLITKNFRYFFSLLSPAYINDRFELVFRNTVSSIAEYAKKVYRWNTPESGVLYINNLSDQILEYRIIALNGATITSGKIDQRFGVTENISSGIYLLNIGNTSETILVK
jgi:photosystem II stability/assembly factor-like uncharacterized protein